LYLPAGSLKGLLFRRSKSLLPPRPSNIERPGCKNGLREN
jgi:hypothetical protein